MIAGFICRAAWTSPKYTETYAKLCTDIKNDENEEFGKQFKGFVAHKMQKVFMGQLDVMQDITKGKFQYSI